MAALLPVCAALGAVPVLRWLGGGVGVGAHLHCLTRVDAPLPPPPGPLGARPLRRPTTLAIHQERSPGTVGTLCSQRDDFWVWLSPCFISSRQAKWDCFFVASALKRSFVSILRTEISVRSKPDSRQKAAGFGIPLLSPGPGWLRCLLGVAQSCPLQVHSSILKGTDEMIGDALLRFNLSNS